jgi:hypothetical protein
MICAYDFIYPFFALPEGNQYFNYLSWFIYYNTVAGSALQASAAVFEGELQ